MSEQQPTGATVYTNGEAINHPDANAYRIIDQGFLEVAEIGSGDAVGGGRKRALALYAAWDSIVLHRTEPSRAESPAEGATVTLTAATVRALSEQVSS